jgi:hypothetical protein
VTKAETKTGIDAANDDVQHPNGSAKRHRNDEVDGDEGEDDGSDEDEDGPQPSHSR